MHYKYRFTVFTATYNCGHLIHRVFESLRKQTFKDFEWIVVNDGSTDNTEEVIKEFETEADFPIKYFAQENKGKPAATNFGINRAEGELFIILDADDEFVDECLETFNKYYEKYLMNSDLSHIVANSKTQHGELHGTLYPKSPLISNEFEVRFTYKVKGEKCSAVKTKIRKEFPLNDKVDKFVPETHFWYAVADKYNALFVNDILRIYYVNQKEYESLSSTKKINFPKGRRYRDLEVINKYLQKVKQDKKFVKKTFTDYIRFSIHSNISIKTTFKDVINTKNKIKLLLYLPLGFYKAHRDRKKGRI